MARKWIKLWVAESLRGTIRFDFTPAERGVWYDLLALAGDCRQDGLIAPGSDEAYPLRWIAGTLNISPSLLQRTLEKCKTYTRIEVNGHGILILNWNRYQSEYERQKPFRAKKVTSKVTQKLPVEGEGEGEEEEDKPLPLKRGIDAEIKLPDWLNKETWDAFLKMRKKQKSQPTDHAIRLLIKELEKLKLAGDDPNEVLNRSVMNSWKGVFPLNKVREAQGNEKYQGNPRKSQGRLPDRHTGYTEPPYDPRLAAFAEADRRASEVAERESGSHL